MEIWKYILRLEHFFNSVDDDCNAKPTVGYRFRFQSFHISADIKYAERIYDVVTQCMRLKTVRDVMERNRRLTLSNIGTALEIGIDVICYLQALLSFALLYPDLGLSVLVIAWF